MLYRDKALEVLKKELSKLDDTYSLLDYELDTLIRLSRNLPARPKNNPPYEGIFGKLRLITLTELKAAVPFARSKDCEEVYDALDNTLKRYSINTPLRISHFISQIAHESGNFYYRREIANGQAYEGRLDLGNTQVGDGRRFVGRGLIQITGRANYSAYSKYTNIDFISNPELLEKLPHCVDSAGWFWSIYKRLNPDADRDDINTITRVINGGFNGLEDRRQKLIEAKAVFVD